LKLFDVAIKQPFKAAFHWLYNQWITTVKYELRLRSILKHTPLLKVCDWIHAAWHSVFPEIVEKYSKLLVFPIKWTGVRIS
jgi:hypothetical protein